MKQHKEIEVPTQQEVLNKVFAGIKADANAIPDGFRIGMTGEKSNIPVLQYATDDGKWSAAAGPILPLGMARDVKGKNWSNVVVYIDRDDNQRQHYFPASALVTGSDIPVDFIKSMVQVGLFISNGKDAKKQLCKYLHWSPKTRYTLTKHTGWYGANTFVTPNGSIGPEKYLLTEQMPALPPAGTLQQWQKSVSIPSIGNSRLVFAISIGLASPLLKFGNAASGGFHYVGDSSQGKSVAARCCVSVWSGNLPTWDSTKNGIENHAANHSGIGTALDEIGQADSKAIAEIVYMLGNGEGKARSTATGENRETKTWSLYWLSTGETSLDAKIREIGKTAHAGQQLRIADVDADAGAGMGLFENIPDDVDPASFADQMERAGKESFGTAGPAFVEYLSANQSGINQKLKSYVDDFTAKNVKTEHTGQVKRVAGRFAQVAAAGEMATDAGVTQWREGDALAAASTCFKSWLSVWRATTTNKESQRAIEQVSAFISQNEARFDPFVNGANTTTPTLNRAGFVKDGNTDPTCRYWLIFTKVFNEVVCKGMRPLSVKQALDERQQIERDHEGKLSKSYKPESSGSKQRFVVVYDTVKSLAGEL